MIPPIARRFVAGETPERAFEHARETNEEGVKLILNLLGEHYDDVADVEADTEAYERLIADIGGTHLDACASVKPSQLGIDIDDGTFARHFRRVVEAGREHGVFVWCDMEDADTTDATLDTFEELAREHDGGVGQCVQANLRRTRSDLDRLADVPGKLRLVKGAYDEGETLAYTDKADVNEAYREDLEFLFKERDDGIAVGSHDPKMISYAQELHDEYGSGFEIQMLMGVREDAQRRLAREGYDVWQYAPYGDKWLAYFYRRVRERRENLTFALRAVAGV